MVDQDNYGRLVQEIATTMLLPENQNLTQDLARHFHGISSDLKVFKDFDCNFDCADNGAPRSISEHSFFWVALALVAMDCLV